MVGALVLLFGWIWWLSSRPENKDKQWGVALIQDLVKKHVSYLMGFVLVTNLASAGIAAAIAGEHSNPAARMTTHFAIFAVSVFGAFSLLPSWRMAFTKDEVKPGRRAARIIAFLIMFGFAVVAPIANMYLIAHSLHQVPQLNMFFLDMNPFISDDKYISALINSGIELPDNIRAYSPFQGMETILAAEIVVLILGMSVLFVEVLTAPDNHVKTGEQITDEADKKKKEEEEKKKKEEEDKNKKKEPAAADTNAFVSNISKILAYVGRTLSEEKLASARARIDSFSVQDQLTVGQELDDMYEMVIQAPTLKTDKERKENEEKVDKLISTFFERSPKELGIGSRLPAKKK